MSQNTQTQNPDAPQPAFSPADLKEFENLSSIPHWLREATPPLVKMALKDDGFPRFEESFSSYSEGAASTRVALRLCRSALDFLEADFLAQEAEELAFLRREVKAFEALTPKTPAETVADAYWQAMEKLSAAGLSFEALFDYHCQSDGETEA